MRKKSKQLVCQYLEKVSRSAIEKHQDIIKEFIRGRHGIYALYKNSKLVYVGLATNLKNRLNSHLRDRHASTWNRFSIYITIDNSKLRELETLMLRIASPGNNKQYGRFALAEDLKRKFRKHIQNKQKNELRYIFDDDSKQKPLVKQVNKKEKKSGRKPVLAKYAGLISRMKMLYKGKTYYAGVNKSGIVSIRKKKFNSPSLAAISIANRSMNGWFSWKYQRSPGEWVFIDELRKK